LKQLVSRPRTTIEADGVQLPDEDVRALGEIRIKQALSMPAQVELTFRGVAGPLSAAAKLAPGAAIRISVQGFTQDLFNGQVTAVEQVYEASRGRELCIRGYDLLHRLRKRNPVRAHVQVTAKSLAEELVADVGLSVDAAFDGPTYQQIIQHHQSDLDLLIDVAARCGLYATVRDGSLALISLEGSGDSVKLVLGESLLEARIELNGEPACRTVKAAGWDPLRDETHEATASAARLGRNVAAEVAPSAVGGSGTRELADEAAQDDQHAEGLAQAELDLRVAREVTLRGTAAGDPRLRPGTPVEITGVADSIAGRYVLTEVIHTIDERAGFISEISTAPPAPRPRSREAIAAPGVVTRVDDPDKKGRVKVSLPTYANLETEWMGVLSAGAGAGKGLMTLPDVGDHVLVLFAHGNPSEGMVLGGLYGIQGPPDPGVEGGNVRRYTLLTHEGLKIQLDDVNRSIKLSDPKGSYFELTPQRVRVHAAVDLVLEAPGQAVKIRGNSIDFERV
jgi:uncharacterized protein involved in type VI secretion and phage assembly